MISAANRPAHVRLLPPPDAEPSAPALIALAQAEEAQGRRAAARELYERALHRFAGPDEARAHAPAVVRWIARTYQQEANAEAALDCLEAALAVAEAWGDEAAVGHAINLQAVVHWQTGALDTAERLYLLARARALRAGDARLAAMTAQNLGVLANIRGDYDEAQRHYEASLAEYRTLGLTRDVAYALNNLGLLHTARRHWAAAERALAEAAQVCDLAGDVATRIAVDVNLAELWVARGEFAPAQSAVARALADASRTGDGAAAVGQATKLLGVCAREAGDFAGADAHFTRADELAAARQDVLLQAEIAKERADLARRVGRNRDVLQQLNRAHRLFSQLRARAELADVDRRLGGLEEQFLLVARRWGESIEAKDRYTQGHCQRVADLACRIAEHAGPAEGFDAQAMFWFRIGALLHDVGKIVIPPEVLNKPGKLTDEEWVLMRSHTTAGVEALADVEFPWDVRPLVESHHERWDGRGYPHRLEGEAIPLTARILCVADVYDALTSVRSYKKALSHDEAVDIMRRDVGTMFDPQVFVWFEAVAPEWAARGAPAAPPPAAPAANEAPGAPPPPPAGGAAAPPNTPGAPSVPGTAADALGAPPDDAPAPSGALDDLTGLPLRRAFRDTAERILAARRATGRPVSLLVIDVDHFKLVNDTFGHLQGDDVLRTVAEQIRAHTRPSDYPARYAGDEFVVLLPGTRLDEARAVGERVRSAVARAGCARRDGSAAPVQVTLSIGVAAAPPHGETLEALFAAADAALYEVKRAGRNAVGASGGPGGRRELLLDCFVGRAAERRRLKALLEEAARGRPHVLAVCGEAGVGKSTLLRQLAPDVGIRAGSLLVGRCIEADVRPPYAPWADVVRGILRAGFAPERFAPGGPAPERPWRELARLVPELGALGVASGGALGSALGAAGREPPAPPGAALAHGASAHGAPAHGAPYALLEELEAFLTLAAERRPLVVVLDDMQWADAATWDALEYLVSRLGTQRLLVCLTVRAEDLDAAGGSRRGRLTRADCYSELALARLTEADLAQWLRTALGGQEPDPALLAHLVAQSEGNALFALQTLRALADDGRLRSADGRWVFDGAHDAALPRAVHDLLARRVARLDRPRREVLTVAAVLGREFDPETLVAASERDEDAVLDALDAGLQAAVLVPAEHSATALAFAHTLLTRVLQAGVNPLRLRRIHERVGRALEARGGHVPAEVALHFDRAGCAADAYRTATEAGGRAAELYAYETAAEFFEMARRHARDVREMADVEWRVAQVADIRGRFGEAEAACDAVLTAFASGAAELGVLRAARRMRERLRLHRGAPAAPVAEACAALLAEARAAGAGEEVVPLLVLVSTAHARLGDPAAAERVAREAVDEAERLGDVALQAEAAMRLGSAVREHNPADSVPHYRRALDAFTRVGDRYGQLRCQINIGVACDSAGNNPAAEVSYATALAIGRDIRAGDLTALASLNLGVLLLKTGRFEVAQERFEEARHLFALLGNELHRLAALYNLASASRARGDAAGALELYGATAALAETLAYADVRAGALAGAGLAELDLGGARGAREQHAAVQALLAGRTDPWFQGRELCEALAVRLAALDGRDPAAAELLLDALDRAERHSQYAALWLGAECAGVLRTAGRAGGRVAEATLHRYLVHARALGYDPLVARLRGEG